MNALGRFGLALVLLAAFGCGTKIKVTTNSMEPTIKEGTTVRITGLGSRALARGDLVLVRKAGNSLSVVRRVIAVSGETVEIRGGAVLVNGSALAESYRSAKPIDADAMNAVAVPDRAVFVLGDNLRNSIDSRHFGTLSMEEVLGFVAGSS